MIDQILFYRYAQNKRQREGHIGLENYHLHMVFRSQQVFFFKEMQTRNPPLG
jgi:hypothetical protein